MKTIVTVIAMATLVSSAMAQGVPPNTTPEWFLAHPDRIAAVRNWCGDNPTKMDQQLAAGDMTCLNASRAAARILEREAGVVK